ncbi:MAG TPA: alpha/beta hydrolase-fold protein [Gemmatimonadota bacterium]|nr:alpha/beta hydrolase-fold protein [Gemmatimonadota bacterium]
MGSRSGVRRSSLLALGMAAVSVALASACGRPARAAGSAAGPPLTFRVSFSDSIHEGPITGRAFVIVSRDSTPPPRLQAGSFVQTVPMFAVDVDSLAPGATATIDGSTLGYPVRSLGELPPGDYFVQALMNVYTRFERSDGHTIWAHMDRWEGQQFNRSPGNLVSDVRKVHLDPSAGRDVPLELRHVLPPVRVPPDTKWVKRVRIRSDLLTKFWGHPMHIGATVLLPEGYDEHPDARYPVVFEQGHFGLGAPFGFSPDSQPVPPGMRSMLAGLNRETGHQLYREWTSPGFPRMIAVTFQHPTPYFDDSYAVNSANNGPYGDAIMQELIPYLESHFRMLRKPWARVLTGGSTGGWESIALQVYHPDFFGGTWTLYPDPVDFRSYDMVDIYSDTSAFVYQHGEPGGLPFAPLTTWTHPERYIMRLADGQPLVSVREFSRLEAVLGSHGRSGQQLNAWEAVFGPVGEDGYPKPLWDKRTGHIDPSVAEYMKEHGYDLRAYLAAHWKELGPKLKGKIHVDVGDADNFYLNLAVYRLQAFMDSTTDPHVPGVFHYGRPQKSHGWQHTSTAGILREMARQIEANAPEDAPGGWRYR